MRFGEGGTNVRSMRILCAYSAPAAEASSRSRWFSPSTFSRNNRNVIIRLIAMGIHSYMTCSMLRQPAL